MNRHRFGEHVPFIGDNAGVARGGRHVDRERVKLFTLMGTLREAASVLPTLIGISSMRAGYLPIALCRSSSAARRLRRLGNRHRHVFGAFINSMIGRPYGYWDSRLLGASGGGWVFRAAVIFHLIMERRSAGQRLDGSGLKPGN
jgi:hypothetical protein